MKKLNWRSGLVICLTLISLLLIAGCSEEGEKSGDKAAGDSKNGGTLRIVEASDSGTPFGIPWEISGAAGLVTEEVYQTLLRMDRSAKLVPLLATDWEVNAERTAVTFNLRKGVKFHDGSDFNAEVVRYNLQKYIDNKRPGTQDFTSVEAVDEDTVRVNLKKYQNTTFAEFSGMKIMSQAYLEKNGVEKARWNPVGTGPFEFVSHEPKVVTKYKKFAGYWEKGKPYLDAIELRYIQEPMTQKATMQAGEADVLGTQSSQMISEFKALGFTVIHKETGTLNLLPDSANSDSPFAKKQVREAVEHAINREAIAKARGFGYLTAAEQLALPDSPLFRADLQGRKYDPAKAKQLLAEAGYPNGFSTEIIAFPMAVDRDAIMAVQRNLQEVGIKAEVNFPDMGRFSVYRAEGWKNALIAMPFNWFPNPNRTIGYYFADPKSFPSMARPEALLKQLADSSATVDVEKAKAGLMTETILKEAAVIPLYHFGQAYITQKNVSDTGHMTWGTWSQFNPQNARLSK